MSDALILQELLKDIDILWRLHNCKLLKSSCVFDAPLPLYVHYEHLADEQKNAHSLDFETLKRLEESMDINTAANILGIDCVYFKKAWQIKYIASVVIFCEALQVALRFHISNTAKSAQAVYHLDKEHAWQSQLDKWQAFGVVDILYKGNLPLYSHADDEIHIPTHTQYRTLPNTHSLSLLRILNESLSNETLGHFKPIKEHINAHLLASNTQN